MYILELDKDKNVKELLRHPTTYTLSRDEKGFFGVAAPLVRLSHFLQYGKLQV